jgi:phosphotransferase system enzyme I (PtsP)
VLHFQFSIWLNLLSQIRAILKAGVGHSDVRIMFPMISSIDEFMTAKRIVLQCIEELQKEGAPCLTDPKIGVMIELPSVLEIIEELADVADFFSIGTNDFIQYMLAVDRTNEKVSDLYLPHHPAILRALRRIVVAALKYEKDVSICGDMSHDPIYIEFLLGIGVRKLSLNPTYIPKIQSTIQSLNIGQAQKHAEKLLKQSRLREITEILDL